jgi:hypothetical protein
MSALRSEADRDVAQPTVRNGRIEDGRGSLGHSNALNFCRSAIAGVQDSSHSPGALYEVKAATEIMHAPKTCLRVGDAEERPDPPGGTARKPVGPGGLATGTTGSGRRMTRLSSSTK